MYNGKMPPRIFVSTIPEEDETFDLSGAVELTCGTRGYMVNDDIEGLTRPEADIPLSNLAGANASRMSDSSICERNIVFDIIPIPNTDANRDRLYYVLPYDEMLRFYFIKGEKRVFIDGKIEKMQGAFKPNKPFVFSVSILCPYPWFQSLKRITRKLIVGDNEIHYNGDIPAGFTLGVPSQISPPLIGAVGDLSITIGGKTFAYTGNVAVPHICTIPGEKAFTGMRSSQGNASAPAFGAMTADCQWPTISRKSDKITVSCSTSTADWFNQQNIFTYRENYSGV